jgi:hypothetical protein
MENMKNMEPNILTIGWRSMFELEGARQCFTESLVRNFELKSQELIDGGNWCKNSCETI